MIHGQLLSLKIYRKAGFPMLLFPVIKAELYKKGVNPEYIENALSESDTEDTEEIIDALLEKRIKNTPIDLKEKQKHINFLLRRGFKYDDIKSVIEKYC